MQLRRSTADGLVRAFAHPPGVGPTRASKVEATATAPSAAFTASAGSGRGAGPPITSAPFLGSKTEAWQEQTKAL